MNRHHNSQILYKDESRLFYTALALCCVVVFGYVYFVSQSVMHVVMRKEVDTQLVELAATVSELEAEYIEEQHAVSNDIATMRGFVIAKNKIFIDKGSDTLVLLQE